MSRDTFDMFNEPERGRFGDGEREDGARPPRARVTGASDLHDLTLALHHQTERAVLVSATGDEAKAQWLPKSRIEIEILKSYITGRRRNGTPVKLQSAIVTLPEPLAVEKGLM